jgi:hypothetical protein
MEAEQGAPGSWLASGFALAAQPNADYSASFCCCALCKARMRRDLRRAALRLCMRPFDASLSRSTTACETDVSAAASPLSTASRALFPDVRVSERTMRLALRLRAELRTRF